MQSKILVGAKEFMNALKSRALAATQSLYVQAMTFEGDSAGESLINLMIHSPAKDKRLIIDSFSKVVVSDHFVFGARYLKDSKFRAEVHNTYHLIDKARSHGIQVKFINPTGPMMLRYPLRNHKKMMIVDQQYAFIGGINFSEHNFEWYDMMVELKDPSTSDELSKDFLQTWKGVNQSKNISVNSNQLFFFNGIKSERMYEEFFDLIRKAKKNILVISPYISDPLLPILMEKAKSGIKVDIISPEQNNKGFFYNYLIAQSSEGQFNLYHHPGMFHLKAILIDSRKLIFGSSNYDLISYHFEQEVVVVCQETSLIQEFITRIVRPMKEISKPYFPNGVSSIKSKMILKIVSKLSHILSRSFLKPA
ncbi:phospholipase D-like domain-containing protein [Reichenbachiella ulvae]|uniref:Phosphatidylserine/phosphatidylglycerophosphate/ cardiolipin synthase family protein n=1 Tax=Reichenbachiella ulvae TaxID=2980104 RepID=A0ABT3CUP8_9BACT|nr:phosphatidylserine/phosphatidylglycerophosphate/cardiolipin synthase family protein [Reichenbachiella ulvae]MCV9387249.1 phosphatidylserine/phosphatidylglycerophosphate/cardiolipin synthase family protein [Reichenbachiella ulvae]